MNNPKTTNELARTLAFHVETGLTQVRMAKAKNVMGVSIVERGEIDRHLASAIEQYEEIRQKLAATTAAPQVADCPNCEASAKEVARLRNACAKQNHEIEQTIARALGYPRYADDPKNWPDAAAENSPDVCAGDHVAETLAAEIAEKYAATQAEIAQAREDLSFLGASQYSNRRLRIQMKDYGKWLKSEGERLGALTLAIATAAESFTAEAAGLEFTDAGKQLLEAVAAWRSEQEGR